MHAESVIVFMAVSLLVPPLLFGFTAIANTAYRAVPLFVFFATGAGMLLGAGTKNEQGAGSKVVSYAVVAAALVVVSLAVTSAVVPSLIPSIAFR